MMPGYQDANAVEQRGMDVLLPFLKLRIFEGHYVLPKRGPISKAIQKDFGDFLFNSDADTIRSIELKIEEKYTGNLYLETWSNRNLENFKSYAERGMNPGWFWTSKADFLGAYFLDTDDFYIASFFKLRRWAFKQEQIFRYPEKPQQKYSQLNDTWGRCVTISDLPSEVCLKHFKPLAEAETVPA